MTSVNDGKFGVGEEIPVDAFNVSEGQDALDLAGNDSFKSVGSLPPSVDSQSVDSDGFDTTLDVSNESSLPSPDSAIGGTPGLTPDLDTPSNQYYTPVGKIPGMKEEVARNAPEEILPSKGPSPKALQQDGGNRQDSGVGAKSSVETNGKGLEEDVSDDAQNVPEVNDDRLEDGGYEEDDEGEEDGGSEGEMIVEAAMMFPLAKKPNEQEVNSDAAEQAKLDKAVIPESSLDSEPTAEVTVRMKHTHSQPLPKEASPSGCESDIEDNDEEDSMDETVAPAAALLVAGGSRIPTSLQLPETVVRLDTPQGSSVFLVGTAHFSRESQDDVANTIRAVKPDIVVVELCKARTAILQLDEETILQESRSLDFKKVQMILRQHGKVQGVLYLLLLSVSAHITKQLGMAPGGEFRTAFAEARRSAPGCLIQFGDRPIQVTLSRALASLSLWHKVKLTWHILTSKEPISKEEVEKCKQKDFIEEMLAEMTGQFPAISEVFVKERDIYLCRSLQAAAQPVPNPTSLSGIAPRVVVGVVGIGHVPGIVERWGTVTDEDIPPIMVIPPTSLTSHIIKATFKVSVYSLLGYGVYKCLPSSAKSSIQSSVQSILKIVADTLPQKWLK